ncbi:MAG TPA: hypothetical protein VFU11_03575 [Solirubrobacterales bacterium]|nr:hypothetical protein [Solirubrobacterales bacterium]
MHASTRLRRLRRASARATGATLLVALALPLGAAARPGTEVHPRSLHLVTSSFATRGYIVNIETFGHHRVVLSAEKNGQLATYTVRGSVNRHRIRADFGRFGRVNLHFRGKQQPFPARAKAQRPEDKQRRCRGRKAEREVGEFRGGVEFDGQRLYTRLAVGGLEGELRRFYRQVCWFRHVGPEARAHVSSSDPVVPRAAIPEIGFTIAVLSARGRVDGSLTHFSAINLESPFGIPIPRSERLSIVTAYRQERVGRIRVFRSTFLSSDAGEVRISRRGVQPAKAQVELGSPFSGTALFRDGTSKSRASWQGDLVVRLPGTGALPLTGPGFHASLCRVSAFRPHSRCFRQAEARLLAAQGSGSHSHPLALARLSSLR